MKNPNKPKRESFAAAAHALLPSYIMVGGVMRDDDVPYMLSPSVLMGGGYMVTYMNGTMASAQTSWGLYRDQRATLFSISDDDAVDVLKFAAYELNRFILMAREITKEDYERFNEKNYRTPISGLEESAEGEGPSEGPPDEPREPLADGWLNRHDTPLPTEQARILIRKPELVGIKSAKGEWKDVEYDCDWHPYVPGHYNAENQPSEGYLGTAKVRDLKIGFNAWRQNDSEFVLYKLVGLADAES